MTSFTLDRLQANLRDYDFSGIVPVSIWEKIVARFGEHKTGKKALADKLARKHRSTTVAFWDRAISEYKKFVYLGMCQEKGVVPSYWIDLVWHEHFGFHEEYERFCTNVLGGKFYHRPDLLPRGENNSNDDDGFDFTVALYTLTFGEAPEDIWRKTKFKRKEKDQSTLNPAGANRRFVDLNPNSNIVDVVSNRGPQQDAESSIRTEVEFGGGDSGGGGSTRDWSPASVNNDPVPVANESNSSWSWFGASSSNETSSTPNSPSCSSAPSGESSCSSTSGSSCSSSSSCSSCST